MPRKKIGIIGATGYTGSELVRILHTHSGVDISVITSESRAGERFSDVHPFFYGLVDQQLHSVESIGDFHLDLVFLALPHGVSMSYVRRFRDTPWKMVDLSGDFRLAGPEVYREWYGKEHVFPEGFGFSAYGIPEWYRDDIRKARLIANPGCYPTSAILALAPLVAEGIAGNGPVIVDSKSGVTGAGVKSKPVNHFSNVNDNFKAYGLKRHRHTIEIQERLDGISDGELTIQFTPHLLPVDRGILSTIYLRPKKPVGDEDLRKIFQKHYGNEPFIRLRPQVPAVKDVRATNFCDIFATYDDRTGMIIVISAIDNLVKGAAGQAVQNMNLLFGWDESAGLHHLPVHP